MRTPLLLFGEILSVLVLGAGTPGLAKDVRSETLHDFERSLPSIRVDRARVELVDTGRPRNSRALEISFDAVPDGQRAYPAVVFEGDSLGIRDFSRFEAIGFWVHNPGDRDVAIALSVRDADGRRSFTRPARVVVSPGGWKRVVCRLVLHGLDRGRIESLHFFQESNRTGCTLWVDDLELLSPLAQRIVTRVREIRDHLQRARASAESIGVERLVEADADRLATRLDDISNRPTLTAPDRLIELSQLAQEASRLAGTIFVRRKALGLEGSHVTDEWLSSAARIEEFTSVDLESTAITDDGLGHLKPLEGLYRLSLGSPAITGAGLRHLTEANILRLDFVGSSVNDTGLEAVAALSRLESIDLAFSGVTSAGLRHVSGLERLKSLRLDGTRVDDQGLSYLRDLVDLDTLLLDETDVDGSGLSELGRLAKLKSLTLRRTPVTDAGLAGLRAFRGLQHLILTDTQIIGTGLAGLKDAPKLRTLNLNRTRVGDAALVALGNTPSLARLMLSSTRITDASLAHLSRGGRLVYLDIYGTNVTGAGIRRLAVHRGLKEFYAGGTATDDEAMSALESLGELVRLDLKGTRITDESLASIAKLKKLSSLTLAHNEISGSKIAELVALEKLRSLDLGGTGISNEALEHIAKLTELRTLALSDTEVSSAGLEAIGRLGKLTALHLDGTRVDDRGLKHLSGIKNLRELHLGRTAVTDSGVAALLSSGRLRNLRILGLAETDVSGVGLAGLGDSLQSLDLARTTVRDVDIEKLRGRESLRRLDLAGTPVTDRSAETIAQLPNLQMVDLSATGITDRGVRRLAPLVGLRELRLDNTALTDFAAEALVEFSSLQEVSLEGTRVTAGGKAHLVRQRPDVSVSLDAPWASGPLEDGTSWSTYSLALDADFERLRELPNLHSVELRGRRLAGRELTLLRDLPKLESLDLADTDLDDGLAAHLIGLQRLRVLRLSRTRITDAALVHLEGMKNLESLVLDGTRVTGSGLQYLERLERLRSISLRDSQFADSEAPRLAALTSLRKVVLTGTNAGDATASAVARLPSLRYLDLYGTLVTDTGVEAIAGVSSLTHLYLDATDISDEGLRSVARLPDLVELGAGHSRVTDRGLEHLRKLRRLERLRIGHCEISSAGVAAIAEIPTLRRFELDGADVGDDAVAHLLRGTSIEALVVDGTHLSAEGIEKLAALPSLEKLSVHRTKITADAVARLRGQRPDLVIDHGQTARTHSALGIALSVLYGLIAAAICLYGFHRYLLLWLFARKRDDAVPSAATALFSDLPRVTIQLPLFNERNVAARVIEACSKIEYPNDRLQIQVLDDSTDESARIARETCDRVRGWGIDIEYRHRDRRDGFKAGALAEGLRSASGEFIAIFDADFVPPRTFLRDTIHHFTDEKVGVVQVRWAHLNRDQSLLTRCQAMFLDGHFVVEQAVRASSGRWFNFNGTAGIWRRECIDRSGGWQHDTLTEDTDLSYRAQMDGWRFVYRPDVQAAAELPSTMSAFLGQQHRWTKGLLQNAIKLLPRILRSRAPASTKAEAAFHLTAPIVYSVMFILSAVALPSALIALPLADLRGPEAWAIGAAVFLMGTLAAALFVVASQRALGLSLWRTLACLPALMALGVGMSAVNARAALGALAGIHSPFVRTPKFGGRTDFDVDPSTQRRQGAGRFPPGLVELGVAGLLISSLILSVRAPFALIGAPFLILFATGFFWVGTARLLEAAPRSSPASASVSVFRGRVLRGSYAAATVALVVALVLSLSLGEDESSVNPRSITVGVDMTGAPWRTRGHSIERAEVARDGLTLGVALAPSDEEGATDGSAEGEVFVELEGALDSLGESLAAAREAVFDVRVPLGFSGELQAFVSDTEGKSQYGSIAFVERHDARRRIGVSIAPSSLTPAMGYTDPEFDPERSIRRIGLKVSAQSDRVRGRGYRSFRGDVHVSSVRVVRRTESRAPEIRTISSEDRYVPSPGSREEFVSWSGADRPWPFGYAFSGPFTEAHRKALDQSYEALRRHGLGFTRVYVGDYRTGLVFDETGGVTGIEPAFVEFLDGLAESANRHGVTVMFSLMDNTVLDGKGIEHPKLIVDPVASSRFIDSVLVPIVARLEERQVVWDLFNEPENVTATPLSVVQSYVDRVIERLRGAVPDARLTVVSRGVDDLVFWRGRGLDILSHNVFDLMVLASAVAGFDAAELDAPVMIAEMDPKLATRPVLEALRGAGYRGVGLWGWGTDDKYDWKAQDLDRIVAPLAKLAADPEAER